jgi:hypothetical protein
MKKWPLVLFLLISLFLPPLFSNLDAAKKRKKASIEKASTYTYKLTIGTLFMNEAPWLKEWIEYHRLLGVEHFYLYNNDSTDEYLEVLTPYIEEGLVELIPWNLGSAPWIDPGENWHWVGYQLSAFNDCMSRAKGIAKWVAIIDVDEFIVPLKGLESLRALLDYAPPQLGGLTLPWRCFGTSEVWDIPKGKLMTEMLTHRAKDIIPAHRLTKTIHRPEALEFCHVHDGTRKEGYYKFDLKNIRINHYQFRGRKNTLEKRCGLSVDSPEQLTPEALDCLNHIEQVFNHQKDQKVKPYLPALKRALGYAEPP